MRQALDKERQDATVVKVFIEAFEDNFKYAERIWTANPDLRDRMTHENSAVLDAKFKAAGGIGSWLD